MRASRAIVSTDAKRARTEIREKICRKSFDLRDREGDLTLDLKFKYRRVYGTHVLVRTRRTNHMKAEKTSFAEKA